VQGHILAAGGTHSYRMSSVPSQPGVSLRHHSPLKQHPLSISRVQVPSRFKINGPQIGYPSGSHESPTASVNPAHPVLSARIASQAFHPATPSSLTSTPQRQITLSTGFNTVLPVTQTRVSQSPYQRVPARSDGKACERGGSMQTSDYASYTTYTSFRGSPPEQVRRCQTRTLNT
jgi:hypothetical protein